MSGNTSHTDLIENQAYFRKQNERVRKNFDEIARLAHDSGQTDLIRIDDTKLHFMCECSDEDCQQRIVVKPSDYNRIHANRRHFTVKPGHEVSKVEDVILRNQEYIVVQKIWSTPESGVQLNETDVSNV